MLEEQGEIEITRYFETSLNQTHENKEVKRN